MNGEIVFRTATEAEMEDVLMFLREHFFKVSLNKRWNVKSGSCKVLDIQRFQTYCFETRNLVNVLNPFKLYLLGY
jgi:hypothetical protein